MVDQSPGCLFIVAAPSGGGKTSLVKKLVHDLKSIEISISHTTRAMRPNEVDGVDYFFVDDQTFNRMIEENAFIEHACVFNHLYGTSTAQIKDRLHAGIDVLLDIDWQGAQQIKHLFKDAIGIFVVPPSLDALKHRLKNRQQDNDEVIKNRMHCAQDELSHYAEFDYLIVNDNFDRAASELIAVVTAERLRLSRQAVAQRKLLSFLLASQ
jgi:guanylate kinase